MNLVGESHRTRKAFMTLTNHLAKIFPEKDPNNDCIGKVL